eukprot:3934884-Rhodomonas_salina.2
MDGDGRGRENRVEGRETELTSRMGGRVEGRELKGRAAFTVGIVWTTLRPLGRQTWVRGGNNDLGGNFKVSGRGCTK